MTPPVVGTLRALLFVVLLLGSGCAGQRTAGGGFVRSRTIPAADGVTISYDVRGRSERRSSEPSVVLLHGWACDRSHWEAQADDLATDRRVISIDFAGHGTSGGDRSEWSLAGLADDVARVVRRERLKRVVLVGHSMGGPVALLATAQLADRVERVIGVETLHTVAVEYTPEMMSPFLEQLAADRSGFVAAFTASAFPEDADPELVSRVTEIALATDPAATIGLMRGFIGFDAAGTLAACPVPVYCINTTHGAVTDVDANRRVNAKFDAVMLAGAGHFPMLERPAQTTRMLRELLDRPLP